MFFGDAKQLINSLPFSRCLLPEYIKKYAEYKKSVWVENKIIFSLLLHLIVFTDILGHRIA
jgi:hypothetical protein